MIQSKNLNYQLKTVFLILTFIFFPAKINSKILNFESGITSPTTPTPPTSLTAYPSDSKVLLQWVEYPKASDYLIEYKLSSDNNWNIYPDGQNTTPGITLLGLTNEISYDFRISVIVSTIQSNPSNAVSAIPTKNYNNIISNQILLTGQSLSTGFTGIPALSTTQPFSNKMLNSSRTSLIPLTETATGGSTNVETVSSGMANILSYLTLGETSQVSSIVTLNGVNNADYSQLKKGTFAYTNGINRMKTAKNLSNSVSIPYKINAIVTIHGERDERNLVSSETYASYLKEWQNDYETDSKLITGQDSTIPLFLCQMSSWTYYNHPTPSTAIGQLNAAKNDPSKIILVTPKYIFDYNDQHLTNYSYRKLGEYYGKVMKKVLIDKQPWKPLSVETITIKDNVITAEFNVPQPPLQLDTETVMLNKNYGFEYFDNAKSATIIDVSLTSPTTVQITLDKIPTGKGMKLAYAYTGKSGVKPGRNIPNAPKGNLCDSDTTPTFYDYAAAKMGNTLKNWCMTFIEPITVGSPPPTACYETAFFNPDTELWEITGSMPEKPTLECYQSAIFNSVTCQWDVTGTQPEKPILECYQSATLNTDNCQWLVTGTMPEKPILECYQSAIFNSVTCQWDVTGSQPEKPILECYQSAALNTDNCQWIVTGTMPEKPILECYQSAIFNSVTCQWEVTGTQPKKPLLECYQSAAFNTDNCQWEITGTQPEKPTLTDLESATFNTTTCQWEIISSSPSSPNLGIIDREKQNTIKILQNQSTDELIIENSNDLTEMEYILYDINGKKLISDKNNQYRTIININTLPQGIYFLKITSDSGIVTRKFLKD